MSKQEPIVFRLDSEINRENAARYCRKIGKKTSQIVKCTFEVDKDKLSDRQRRLYRMWCKEISNETGDDHESIHYDLCERFLGKIEYQVRGETRLRLATTSDLNVNEMWEFMTRVYVWAIQFFGMQLTTPDSIGLNRELPEATH